MLVDTLQHAIALRGRLGDRAASCLSLEQQRVCFCLIGVSF